MPLNILNGRSLIGETRAFASLKDAHTQRTRTEVIKENLRSAFESKIKPGMIIVGSALVTIGSAGKAMGSITVNQPGIHNINQSGGIHTITGGIHTINQSGIHALNQLTPVKILAVEAANSTVQNATAVASHGDSMIAGITGAVVVGAVLFIGVATAISLYFRKRNKNQKKAE